MSNESDATQGQQPNKHRDKQLNVRINRDLYDTAMERAAEFGLGVVVRALLRAYVAGEVELLEVDLLQEATPAPRLKAKPGRSRKAHR